ncbi:MAG: hypothetical protein JSS20_10360 [Proteobacteria bacterium]|nr:hypothetical protein [Pseudomonadota bacterium]
MLAESSQLAGNEDVKLGKRFERMTDDVSACEVVLYRPDLRRLAIAS